MAHAQHLQGAADATADCECLAVLAGSKERSKAAQQSTWRQKLSLEAQPLMECFWLVAGQPVWEPMYKSIKADFMPCFGSVHKAWNTARQVAAWMMLRTLQH